MEQDVGTLLFHLPAPVTCSYGANLTISSSERIIVHMPQNSITSNIQYEPKFELFVKGSQDYNQFINRTKRNLTYFQWKMKRQVLFG